MNVQISHAFNGNVTECTACCDKISHLHASDEQFSIFLFLNPPTTQQDMQLPICRPRKDEWLSWPVAGALGVET